MEYWWEGPSPNFIPPTVTCDIVGRRHKIGGITFGAAFLCNIVNLYKQQKLFYFLIFLLKHEK